ncbi:NAD(P)-binding domain-containing protein [Polaromonas sp. P1-6]|nr:NAD(P)-binding domain-containing protein [Polaromonas sp. P1-6]
MNILVIGAGNMGAAFVKQLTRAGHKVTVTARNLEKAQAVAAANPGATAVAAANAAAQTEVVVLATGYADAVSALQSVGDLTGKVVIDITNPLTADFMGLTLGYSTSAAEEIAKAVPQANVVKAFNTLFAQVLAEGADFGNGQTATVFVASDSERARQTAAALAQSMGFATIDAGGLKNALPGAAGRPEHLSGLRRGTQVRALPRPGSARPDSPSLTPHQTKPNLTKSLE